MNSGEICALLCASGQPVRVRWRDGLISDLEQVSPVLAAGHWVGPCLVDLQINGFSGIDFQADNLLLDELTHAVKGLAAAGCGRILLTLMTDRWEKLMARLSHLRTLREQSPLLQQMVAGWHLEGPFLSAEPGYCGAHLAELMIDPSLDQIQELRARAGSDPVLVTLAPERPGALEAIALAVSLGMKVSLGHTNASAERLRQACQAGATGFTHLANACPQQLDRHDNILWRALDTPGLTVSVIPDGWHVSPALFRLIHRLLKDEVLYYTSDAVAAAGAPPGRYTVGRHQVEVGLDQIVRQPGKTNYAGSGLRPIEGVFRAAAMLGRPWQAVWELLSTRPAQFMGWSHSLAVGQRADLCCVRLTAEGGPAAVTTWVAGEEIPAPTLSGNASFCATQCQR